VLVLINEYYDCKINCISNRNQTEKVRLTMGDLNAYEKNILCILWLGLDMWMCARLLSVADKSKILPGVVPDYFVFF